MKSINRNSHYEILRIIAMLSVFLSHVPCAPDALAANKILHSFFYCGGAFGVNLFVLIGSWFLAGQDFRAERVGRIVFQTAFYGILFYAVSIILGSDISLRNFILCFSLWFPFGYVCMLCLAPFLEKLNRSYKKAIIITIASLSIIVFIMMLTDQRNILTLLFSKGLFLGPVWYSFIYVFISCYKNKICKAVKNSHRMKYFMLSAILYLLMFIFLHYFGEGDVRSAFSPLCFLSALFLFLGFLSFDRTISNKGINLIASTSFGVYLIQGHRVFMVYIWEKFISFSTLSKSGVLMYMIAALLLFLILVFAALLVDPVWKKLFRKCTPLYSNIVKTAK